jgi:tetratricopeptide (TPR) repeat protein
MGTDGEESQQRSWDAKLDSRVVRVFISSTFRDMQAERDELVKRTFPVLRKLCESRGVTWGQVDLRWGITKEQSAEGQVLPICLKEIALCRPYFIGLLGERYGWIPGALDPKVIEREPWLLERAGRSVTELEILHGVLRDRSMAGHAFFYLRDPAYADSRPADQFRETATPEEIAEHGPKEAQRRAAERRAKLAALKQQVRESGLPVREGYADPRTLGELVLADLTAVIENLYPAGSEPDPLAREAAEHEAFAASRSRVYIGRPEYAKTLNAHAAGDGPPLVIIGDSGSGKSALLANWVLEYRSRHTDEPTFMHFVGASAHGSDWAAMLRRVIEELRRRFDLKLEVPDKPDGLRLAFANALHMAAAKGRVVLVIDALNQLDDREGALDLVWLPPQIPANVRVVLSSLPGRPLAELERRAYPTLIVKPLDRAERERLMVDYLAVDTKALAPAARDRIAAAPQCANPLFLRALLDELRVWGEHETLDDVIARSLAASSTESLFELILARYEADYERDRPGLVRDALSLLWAAHRGLSEAELLDLLGSDGSPLPGAYWAPLYLAAESSLTSRSGLFGFFHDYLRAAVEHRFLRDEPARRAAHLRIADYFAARDIDPRQVEELPWHLARAQAWQRLYELLADLPFLEAAWGTDPLAVRRAWAQVEANSELRVEDAYGPIVDVPAGYPQDHVGVVQQLLRATDHPEQALSLTEHLVERCRESGDDVNLAVAIAEEATILFARGRVDEAMGLYRESERICRETGDRRTLASVLGSQGNILHTHGRLDEAMALHQEAGRISREIGELRLVGDSLQAQSLIREALGDIDGAIDLVRQGERIYRELGDPAGLAVSFGRQANILYVRDRLDEAMALYGEQERIYRELGDKSGLGACMGNQGLIFDRRGRPNEAMALYEEQERICRELGDKHGLSIALGNRAAVLDKRNRLDEAMALYKEKERICRELDDKEELAIALGNRGVVLQRLGRLDDAMALYEEKEHICRELGSKYWLQYWLENHGLILHELGRPDEAMTLFKEKEQVCREIGSKSGLQIALGHQAVLLNEQERLDEALALFTEKEQICRELGDKSELAVTLGLEGLILEKRGRLEEAMALHKEKERICRELGDKSGLAASLQTQAVTLAGRGRPDEAMALLEELEIIRRELGDPQGLASCLISQAFIHLSVGRPREGLPKAEEAYQVASQHRLGALTQQIRPVLDQLRQAR